MLAALCWTTLAAGATACTASDPREGVFPCEREGLVAVDCPESWACQKRRNDDTPYCYQTWQSSEPIREEDGSLAEAGARSDSGVDAARPDAALTSDAGDAASAGPRDAESGVDGMLPSVMPEASVDDGPTDAMPESSTRPETGPVVPPEAGMPVVPDPPDAGPLVVPKPDAGMPPQPGPCYRWASANESTMGSTGAQPYASENNDLGSHKHYLCRRMIDGVMYPSKGVVDFGCYTALHSGGVAQTALGQQYEVLVATAECVRPVEYVPGQLTGLLVVGELYPCVGYAEASAPDERSSKGEHIGWLNVQTGQCVFQFYNKYKSVSAQPGHPISVFRLSSP